MAADPTDIDQIMMNDINWLKELNYDAIICDEAHKAKGLNGRYVSVVLTWEARE